MDYGHLYCIVRCCRFMDYGPLWVHFGGFRQKGLRQLSDPNGLARESLNLRFMDYGLFDGLWTFVFHCAVDSWIMDHHGSIFVV